MHSKVTLINSDQVWNPKRRYKINEVVQHFGYVYQNSTGINTDPLLGPNWGIVKKMDVIPVIYYNEFIDSGTHEFAVPDGILIQNAFLNGAQVTPFSQSGTSITVPNSITNDLVTLTGRN